jgi:hypothetical protein
VIWFAGLRGAIAYALAKRWGGDGALAVEGTTIILVLVTTFGMGGTVGKVVQALDMELTDDSDCDTFGGLQDYWMAAGATTGGATDGLPGGIESPVSVVAAHPHTHAGADPLRPERSLAPPCPLPCPTPLCVCVCV